MLKKKITIFLLVIIAIFNTIIGNTYANEKKKIVVISMNKTNLSYMKQIPTLNKELLNQGYIGLMNTRGDKGNDDKRAYATIGSGVRANIPQSNYIDFSNLNDENGKQFKNTTLKNPLKVNNVGINYILDYNLLKGQYGANIGELGKTLSDNNINVSVLGNADLGLEEEDFNRNIALIAMDNHGRVKNGNVDDINISDGTMPFGIRTDYEKLISQTKEEYKENDVLFIELGDTTRLDNYKQYLNEKSYTLMRKNIYKNIDVYLKELFKVIDESNSIVYIISPTQSSIDYQNKRRLSPVIKFDNTGKGILTSSTTRRDGIIANVDISADILNELGLKSDYIVGKTFSNIDLDENTEFLNNEYQKIVSISTIRSNTINFFVVMTVITWILSTILLLFKKYIPNRYENILFRVSKEFLKLGLIIPLAFLISPIFKGREIMGIYTWIAFCVIVLYLASHILFKNNDLKQIGFLSCIMIFAICIDSMLGTYLMENNIMSYDPIVGARYYGIGNEYEGITIASTIMGISIFLKDKKIYKYISVLMLLVVLLISAHPSMGANVGGAISGFAAYFVFILLMFDIKIDFKKVCLIGIGSVLVVIGFGLVDVLFGSESHLSLFINQILVGGPQAIIQTFGRKISMNIKLSKTSNWMYILSIGFILMTVLSTKYKNHLNQLIKDYNLVFRGFLASIVGCVITLLVNDSGIVSCGTALLYIVVTFIVILIENKQKVS